MNRKLIAGFVCIAAALLLTGPTPSSQAAGPGNGRRVALPDHAAAVVPGKLFWLGTALDQGRLVEGYAIIHPKKGLGKPGGCNNDGVCQGWENASCSDCGSQEPPVPDSTCYAFLAKGARWKTPESYIVDPANRAGLNESLVSFNLAEGIQAWEDAANNPEIIGAEMSETVDGADTITPDGKNEVYFADVAETNAIAITIVWGIFGGPPKGRELVEWDQVYDDQDFTWSDDCTLGCTREMDFPNIAIHELGHTMGLADLYTSDCSAETMYGYASAAETDKRSLEAGDITGISKLYQ